MIKQFRLQTKIFVLALLASLQFITAHAQKGQGITQEMISRVGEIVKPLKEQADNLLKSDATGTFKTYQRDVAALNKMKNNAEKSKASMKIMEKYASFFKEVWTKLKVDEKAYQAKIRSVFPAEIGERIIFQPYLNFSYSSSTNTNTEPPPAPAPGNKCIDVCTIAAGEITGNSGLIAGGGGSYGNCFLTAHSWGVVAGGNNLYSSLKNNISIPGTLPADSRKLRVTKKFELKQEAVAFAILGFGFSETRVTTYSRSEYLMAMAPVIFASSKLSQKTCSEEYLLEKPEVAKSIIKASANTFAYFITGNWSYSNCTGIKWTICEEK